MSLLPVVWGTYPEMKLLDHIILFLILEEPKYCFPTWPYHCTSPPAAYKDSNSSTSCPTRPPGALSYSLTQSFSKYLYKAYRTPEAGDTVRNKVDSACPWEACNLPRNRDSEQMTGGMNIKTKEECRQLQQWSALSQRLHSSKFCEHMKVSFLKVLPQVARATPE